MTISYRRKIIRNPEEVDRRRSESEQVTTQFLSGKITVEEYLEFIKEMREYLDFRRLASDIQNSNSVGIHIRN